MPSTKNGKEKNSLIKPYIKWAGGKRQLLPELIKHIPNDCEGFRYYEPFVGAGALFFELQPHLAVINDNNEQLMLTYKVIQNNIDELIEALKKHKDNNCEGYYYQVRGMDRNAELFNNLSNVEKAARLIYLNKTCYNGLYRVNSRGFFNVPFGRYINPAICDEPILRAIHRYLSCDNLEIKIINGDFASAVEDAGRGSFIYFDPPYHSPNQANFTSYQSGGFGEEEQSRLRDVFALRTDAGARCLLSNSDTPFIRDLYKDKRFKIIVVKAKRFINSDASGRGQVNEVLVKNWG
jgi:DNA adenine methylase